MDLPTFHLVPVSGRRGTTHYFWYSFKGAKHISERYKSKVECQVAVEQEKTKFVQNEVPKHTWLSDDQLKDAEGAVRYAETQGIESITDALKWYAKYSRDTIKAPTVKLCVEQFLTAKAGEGLRPWSMHEYRVHMKKFAAEFGGRQPLAIAPKEIGAYLLRWPHPTTRAHRWRTLYAFFAWAIRQKYLIDNPVSAAMNKPNVQGGEIHIFTPAEAKIVLRKTKFTDQIGYWALALFGSMRTEEIEQLSRHPDPWRVIRQDLGVIDLPDAITKTGARTIAILPVLNAWLKWIKARKVPFFPRNHWEKYRTVRDTALAERLRRWQAHQKDLPLEKRQEPNFDNMARHSCLSFRLALPGASYAEVSDEAGNSETIIRKHYRRKATAEQARQYFSLTPTRV